MIDDEKIAQAFNTFLGTLNFKRDDSISCDIESETHQLMHAVKKYSKHSGILSTIPSNIYQISLLYQ